MAFVKSAAQGYRFPILQGILPLQRSQVPADLMAGITLAALNIPQAMGYTRIAGTPVITGLYAILIPTALFAIFGSSRHLVVGADSATAAILAAGLAGLAASGSPQYVALCGVLAFMAAAMLIIARIIRLGFLADFFVPHCTYGLSDRGGYPGIPGGNRRDAGGAQGRAHSHRPPHSRSSAYKADELPDPGGGDRRPGHYPGVPQNFPKNSRGAHCGDRRHLGELGHGPGSLTGWPPWGRSPAACRGSGLPG